MRVSSAVQRSGRHITPRHQRYQENRCQIVPTPAAFGLKKWSAQQNIRGHRSARRFDIHSSYARRTRTNLQTTIRGVTSPHTLIDCPSVKRNMSSEQKLSGDDIQSNLADVQAKIDVLCEQHGRSREAVGLCVAV